MQKNLSAQQIDAFRHDQFVEDQVRHFVELVGSNPGSDGVIVDMGGGCGFFASRLNQLSGRRIKVVDTDVESIKASRRSGVDAELGDALHPVVTGNEEVVCFNLILHHLIGPSERVTRELQCKALSAWRTNGRAVFINEYIYESYLGHLSGWLIYQITKSRVLSWVGRLVSRVVPALRANTFGVGVRFRAHEEWVRLFTSAGFEVKASVLGEEERIAPPLRLLLIKAIRRDSFLLAARTGH